MTRQLKDMTWPEARKAFESIVMLFHEFGDHSSRRDAGWGWRKAGNALLALGQDGKAELERLMAHRSRDYLLAERAWRVLWLPEWRTDRKFEITEEQDREAHKHRPVFDITGE